ncbi:AzlC family ABC transporter permease [Conexibacter woesei]|uniref:AzlC family ABC transporter permease n=1 Tax=Conexibacter woesei TaxID=191495 RepID=UPI0004117B18|nr:AzlC family ABC transporter permease [Conexibacter woesei]
MKTYAGSEPEADSGGASRSAVAAELWIGARRMAPIAVADVIDGVAFGALAVAVMGHVAPVVMSLTAFSGSAQYAMLAVLRGHGTLAAALLAAVALNARYLAISAVVSARVPGSRWRRAACCVLLTDANWAVVDDGPPARLIGAALTELAAWSGGTALGVAFGTALGDPLRLGLDAAFPALFAWLLRDQLRDRPGVLAALAGATIALALTPLLPPGLPVLAAGTACAAWGVTRR